MFDWTFLQQQEINFYPLFHFVLCFEFRIDPKIFFLDDNYWIIDNPVRLDHKDNKKEHFYIRNLRIKNIPVV